MYKQQLRKLEAEYWGSQNQKNINILDDSGEFMLYENEENTHKIIGSEQKQKSKSQSPKITKSNQSLSSGNKSALLKTHHNMDQYSNNIKIINGSCRKPSGLLFPQNEGFSINKQDCSESICKNLLDSDKKKISKSLFERFCEKQRSEKPIENLDQEQKNLKIRYLLCRETGHEMNQLNMVCLDADCTSRGLLCCMCLERHQNHLARCVPFQKLVDHLRNTDQKYRREFSLECLSSEHATIQTALSRFREGLDSLINTLKINFLRQEQAEIKLLQDAYASEDSRVEQFLQRMHDNSVNGCSVNASDAETLKNEMEDFLNSLDYSFTDDKNEAQTKRARWESKGELASTEILKNLSLKRFSIHQLLEGCLNMLSHTLTQNNNININTNDQIHNFSSHSSSDNQEEVEQICVEDEENNNNEIHNQNILRSVDEKSYNTIEEFSAQIEMDLGEYESCDERQQQQHQRQRQQEYIRIDSLEEISEPTTTKRRKINYDSNSKNTENQRKSSIMIIDSIKKQNIDREEEIELEQEQQQQQQFVDLGENNLEISKISPNDEQTETVQKKYSFIIPTDPSSSSSSQQCSQQLNEGILQDTDIQLISSESINKSKINKFEEGESKSRNITKTEGIAAEEFRLLDYLVSSPEMSSPERNNNVRSNCSSLESKNVFNVDQQESSEKKNVIFQENVGTFAGNNLFNQCNNNKIINDRVEEDKSQDVTPFVQDTLILHKKQIDLINNDLSQSQQQAQQFIPESSSNDIHDLPSNSEGIQQQSQLYQQYQSQLPSEIMTFQEQFESPTDFNKSIPQNTINNSNQKPCTFAAEQVFFSQLSVPGDQYKQSQTAHFGLEYSPTFSPRKFSRLSSSVKSKEQSSTVSPKKYQQNYETASKSINQSPTTHDILRVQNIKNQGEEGAQ